MNVCAAVVASIRVLRLGQIDDLSGAVFVVSTRDPRDEARFLNLDFIRDDVTAGGDNQLDVALLLRRFGLSGWLGGHSVHCCVWASCTPNHRRSLLSRLHLGLTSNTRCSKTVPLCQSAD